MIPMDKIVRQNIIQDLGIDRMPPEAQEEAFGRVGRIIYQAVLMRVAETLDDGGKRELEKVLEKGEAGGDEIFTFLYCQIRSFKIHLPTIIN